MRRDRHPAGQQANDRKRRGIRAQLHQDAKPRTKTLDEILGTERHDRRLSDVDDRDALLLFVADLSDLLGMREEQIEMDTEVPR